MARELIKVYVRRHIDKFTIDVYSQHPDSYGFQDYDLSLTHLLRRPPTKKDLTKLINHLIILSSECEIKSMYSDFPEIKPEDYVRKQFVEEYKGE